MNTMSLTLITGILLTAAPIYAQTDWHPDGLGLYADLEGQSNTLVSGSGPVEAYLLATGVTADFITIWSARLEIEGYAWCTEMRIPYDASVYAIPPPDYIVQADPVLERKPVIHLATFEIYCGDAEPVNLFLRPLVNLLPGQVPVYQCSGPNRDPIVREFHSSTGSWDLPVMTINGTAPLDADSMTWSAVKAAFF